jgi:hypothetical protein
MARNSKEEILKNKTLAQVEKKKVGLSILVWVDGC